MSTEPTPPLSDEGSREVEEEMRCPPADTPERRRMFELMRQVREWKERRGEVAELVPSDLIGSTGRTPPLSDEGSREVEEEMSCPPADTPERRRTIEAVREILAWRKRRAEARDPGRP